MAQNPIPSRLDQQQILQRAFDESEDRLRTDGTFTGTINAEVFVEIDAADGDNLAIANADGSRKVEVTVNNELEVFDEQANLKLDDVNTTLTSIDGKLTSPLTVVGPLTDAQLRASAVPVDGSGFTQPISAAVLPLPTGAATSANQVTGNVSLASIDGKLTALTDTTQKTQIVDSGGDSAEVKQLNTQLTATDKGLVTNAVIHGVTTGGGGGYVDVKVNPSGALTVESTVTSSVLPTGAATAANQVTANASLASIDGKLTAPLSVTGPLTDAQLRATPVDVNVTSSVEVEVKNDSGNPIPINGTVAATQSGTWNINDITGTVSLPTGAATETTLARLPLSQGSTTAGQFGPLVQGAVETAAPAYTSGQTSPLSLTPVGNLRVDGSSVNQPIIEVRAPTATLTNVTSSATSVTLVAANSSRRGVLIYNDSNRDLYVKFGATASLTSFTIKMGPNAFFELPTPVYTGVIDGIWSAASGAARITELT